MHIPDGFLSPLVWAPSAAISVAVVGKSITKVQTQLEDRDIPLMGVTSAFIFAAQMLNFPVAAGTSGHFVGAMLAAIVMGPWAATLIMTAVLIVQCLVFQDGGLLALGTNLFNMGILGVWAGWFTYLITRRLKSSGGPGINRVAIFTGAWVSIIMAAIAASLELALSGTVSLKLVLASMSGYHALIGIGEGLITTAVLEMVARVRPELARSASGGAANER